MVFQNICVLVLCTKVASALEGLKLASVERALNHTVERGSPNTRNILDSQTVCLILMLLVAKGRNVFLRHFQQLWSYRDQLEICNGEEIPFSAGG